MARTDWEAAWVELNAWIAEAKPGYGRQELLTKMATLAGAHQAPEDLIERVARIWGVRNTFPEHINPPEEVTADREGNAVPDKSMIPGPPTTNGGHDGRSSDEEARSRP